MLHIAADVPKGDNIPYDENNFFGDNGLIWTLDPTYIGGYRCVLLNPNTMLLWFSVGQTSVSGGASNVLRVRIPAGKKARITQGAQNVLVTDNGTVEPAGRWIANKGDDTIMLFRSVPTLPWTPSNMLTEITFTAMLEVEDV